MSQSRPLSERLVKHKKKLEELVECNSKCEDKRKKRKLCLDISQLKKNIRYFEKLIAWGVER